MTVYSPFQTMLHLECPLKRLLIAKEKWVPRRIEQRDISAMLGVAIAAGLEVWNKGDRDPASATSTAFTKAANLQQAALLMGRELPDHLKSQWDRVAERAEAGTNGYINLARAWITDKAPPGTPAGTRIVAVEESYGPEGGYARPDLIVNDILATRVPYDYKTSLSLGRTKSEWAKNRERRIGRWAHSFQMFLYAWQEKVSHYYIGHMVLEPEFSFETIRFDIHPETMQLWLQGAEQTWWDMAGVDEGYRDPAMAATHSDEFGECPMKRACFEHHLDPTLMAQDYIQQKERHGA